MKRPSYDMVINDLDLLVRLAEFNPIVIGTPPLGIATEHSDIDIACSANDLLEFSDVSKREFGRLAAFSLQRIEHRIEPAITASFRSSGWDIELFCQRQRTEDQWGVRHFMVERLLLELEPELRSEVLKLKQAGVKTEPAFAQLLGLAGDPYEAMIALENLTEADLRKLARQPFRNG